MHKTVVATTVRFFENVFPLRENGTRQDIAVITILEPQQDLQDRTTTGAGKEEPFEGLAQPAVDDGERNRQTPWPDGDNTRIVFDETNPYKPTSRAHIRYDFYKDCDTVGEARERGATPGDLYQARKKGYLHVLASAAKLSSAAAWGSSHLTVHVTDSDELSSVSTPES